MHVCPGLGCQPWFSRVYLNLRHFCASALRRWWGRPGPVKARRRLSASAIGTLPVSQSRISPVVGDCVVELVGLEPTTKVLWNMVRVRPTPLVGHLSRSPGPFAVLLDFP